MKARYLPVDWWHPDVTNWIKRRTNDMSEDTKAIFWTYKYSHPFKFWLTQKLWKPLHWTLLHTNLSPPPPQTSTCYLSRTMLTATHHETHKVLGSKKKKPSQTQNKSNTQTLKWLKGLTANVPWHSQRCHILALKGQRWHEEDLHDIRQLVWMLWLISLSNCNFVATVSTLLANWLSFCINSKTF